LTIASEHGDLLVRAASRRRERLFADDEAFGVVEYCERPTIGAVRVT
jgi:hypothetical protein